YVRHSARCQTGAGRLSLDTAPKVRHKRSLPSKRRRSRVQAVVFHEFGGLDVLRLEDVAEPTPGPGEVLLDVAACALNHLDVDVREGVSRFPVDTPFILGLEVVGRIAALGDGVEHWQIGDRVLPSLMDV